MQKDKLVVKMWLQEIDINGKNLTKWEEDFIASITEQFERTGSLSDKQEDILERIYVDKA